jgi:hypothetical protein
MWACLEANEMFFLQIYNSHLRRIVLVSLSPDVTFDLQFLTKYNIFFQKIVYNVLVQATTRYHPGMAMGSLVIKSLTFTSYEIQLSLYG